MSENKTINLLYQFLHFYIIKILEFLFFALVLAYILHLFLLIKGWNNLPIITKISTPPIAVSVVIALRNEQHNISPLLQSIKKQSYPYFNCIFVNDHSEDTTYSLLKSNIKDNKKFSLLTLSKDENGKKVAIRKGIKSSDAELIITTDADCTHHPHWIEKIVAYYIAFNKPLMLSGPVRFSPFKNFEQKCMTIEFGSLILTGASSIALKKPNMCNAANLTFQRKAFIEQNDYDKHLHIPTGDDEFFMHQIAQSNPSMIKFIKDKEVIVNTPPPSSMKSFIHQRIRWASKWRHYHNKGPQGEAIFIFLLHFSFLGAIIQLLSGNGQWNIFAFAFFLRILGEYIFNKKVLVWQGDQELSKWVPFVSIFYPFYAIIIGLLATFTKYSWKNRNYNV